MIDRLKAASKKTGLAVSEIIRAAVEAHLKEMGL
jgi:predicted DNA-binding protein